MVVKFGSKCKQKKCEKRMFFLRNTEKTLTSVFCPNPAKTIFEQNAWSTLWILDLRTGQSKIQQEWLTLSCVIISITYQTPRSHWMMCRVLITTRITSYCWFSSEINPLQFVRHSLEDLFSKTPLILIHDRLFLSMILYIPEVRPRLGHNIRFDLIENYGIAFDHTKW